MIIYNKKTGVDLMDATSIGFTGAIVGALIGGIFSYIGSVRATNKGIEAQKLVFKENEKILVKENALIVYYDLYLGLNDVRTLYISQAIHDFNNTPELMFFSNDWIKNVAVLKNELEKKEESDSTDYIQEIYLLYGELFTIKDYLEKVKINESIYEPLLKNSIRSLAVKLFDGDFNPLKSTEEYFAKYPEMIADSSNYFKNYKLGAYKKQDPNSQMNEMCGLYPIYNDSRQKWVELKKSKLDYKNHNISDTYKKILVKLDSIDKKEKI